MKQLIWLAVMLFAWLIAARPAVAQKSYETLLQQLKKHPQADTVRAELLIDACVAATFRSDTTVLKMATEANRIANTLGYELGQIRSLNCLGNYYFSRSLNDKATQYYMQALRLAEKRGDYHNIVIGKSNLANVFYHNSDNARSIRLLTEADQLLVQHHDTVSQNRAAILTNLANAYAQQKEYVKTIQVYEQVLHICRSQGIGFGIALTLDNIGKTYYDLGQFTKALSYLEEAKTEIERHHVDFVRTKNLRNLGQTYARRGDIPQSLRYFRQAETIAQQTGDNEGLMDIYFELQQSYRKSNDFKAAYLALNQYTSLKDSLFTIQKDKTIQELNTKYETEKKDHAIRTLAQQKQITELESERKTGLIYTILAIVVALSVVAYGLFARFRSRKQRELLTTQLQEAERRIAIEQQARDSELKALKSQMNPHFMFNALNSIQEQFMYGDKQVANEQMGNFTYLTRQILQVSGKKKISLATETDILTKYLELEKMRFPQDFTYRITLSDDLDEDYHQLPPMLVQPFAENSMKHGLLHKPGPKELSIAFALSEDEAFILCTVEDNGIGRARSAEIKQQKGPARHVSFSVSATEERLKLLDQTGSSQPMVQFDDLVFPDGSAAGTRVTIRIPLG